MSFQSCSHFRCVFDIWSLRSNVDYLFFPLWTMTRALFFSFALCIFVDEPTGCMVIVLKYYSWLWLWLALWHQWKEPNNFLNGHISLHSNLLNRKKNCTRVQIYINWICAFSLELLFVEHYFPIEPVRFLMHQFWFFNSIQLTIDTSLFIDCSPIIMECSHLKIHVTVNNDTG